MDWTLRLRRQAQRINEAFRTLLLEMDAKLVLHPDNSDLKEVIEELRKPDSKKILVPWLGRGCTMPYSTIYVVCCCVLWYLPFM
tara:strand:- start:43 stop:294 length:252 start_codon:yes stop_codon:yes gene_type:complete